MNSKDSTQTVFNTIFMFNISDTETPDEFIDSKPSHTNFSQPLFQPITPPIPDEPYPYLLKH